MYYIGLMLALILCVYSGTRSYFLVGNCNDLIIFGAIVHHITPKINGTYPHNAWAITSCNKYYVSVGNGVNICTNGTWSVNIWCRGNILLQNWEVNINWYFDNTHKYNL